MLLCRQNVSFVQVGQPLFQENPGKIDMVCFEMKKIVNVECFIQVCQSLIVFFW